MSSIKEVEHLRIPLHRILMATQNFAQENFIGQGGFGKVYQGRYEPHGTVAVKRLDRKGGQGEREFIMEIVMLSCYRHENLVSLVGFCSESEEKVLVYKHESNGSLDKFLSSKDLTWTQRLRICLGAACGLKYLHHDTGPQHRVLHRDIKSSNVLLDENWKAKISDFGLSKTAPANVQFTFLYSNVCGTFGYVDPLYMETGILTKESDVYSFGVVLFEVLCGRLVCAQEYHDERRFLVNLVQTHFQKETLDEIIDPGLRKQMNSASLRTFSTIAYQCLEKPRQERPTMTQVVESLEKALDYQVSFLSPNPLTVKQKHADLDQPSLDLAHVKSEMAKLTNSSLDLAHVKSEMAKLTNRRGLIDSEAVDKLVQLMKGEKKIDVACRKTMVDMISVSDRMDCLCRFLELKGVIILNEWLEEIDGELDEEFVLSVLRVLERLPVNLRVLQTCDIGERVNRLTSYKSAQVHEKAKSLVTTWKELEPKPFGRRKYTMPLVR